MVSEGGEIPARDWRTQCVTIYQMNHPALRPSYPDSQLSTIVCDRDCKHVDFPAFWNPQKECLHDSTVNSFVPCIILPQQTWITPLSYSFAV